MGWLDVIAKVVGAVAVLVVALIANSLQSRLTGISLQSQREQDESKLRADMFTSLISPIAGPQKDGKPILREREALLAQLLALNFHENFELKPLMEHASNGLVAGKAQVPEKLDPRKPLWSVARRIAERQRASIAQEWRAYNASSPKFGLWPGWIPGWGQAGYPPYERVCETFLLTVENNPGLPLKVITAQPAVGCEWSASFNDAVNIPSPDKKYTLRITLVGSHDDPVDWKNQTVKVTVGQFSSQRDSSLSSATSYNFTLTWFDFPFTDNTLLPDGNRYAIYLRAFSEELQELKVIVMWFPKGYFTPRERPLNYLEVQRLLGRNPQ